MDLVQRGGYAEEEFVGAVSLSHISISYTYVVTSMEHNNTEGRQHIEVSCILSVATTTSCIASFNTLYRNQDTLCRTGIVQS